MIGFSSAKLVYTSKDPILAELKHQLERVKEKKAEIKINYSEIMKVKDRDSETFLLLLFGEVIQLVKFCLEEQGIAKYYKFSLNCY